MKIVLDGPSLLVIKTQKGYKAVCKECSWNGGYKGVKAFSSEEGMRHLKEHTHE